MRVSRISETRYLTLIFTANQLKKDAEKLQDPDLRNMVAEFAKLLETMTLSYQPEETEEAGEV